MKRKAQVVEEVIKTNDKNVFNDVIGMSSRPKMQKLIRLCDIAHLIDDITITLINHTQDKVLECTKMLYLVLEKSPFLDREVISIKPSRDGIGLDIILGVAE